MIRFPHGNTVTVWHGSGLKAALDTPLTRAVLASTQPRAVKLHAGPSGLLDAWNPPTKGRGRRHNTTPDDLLPAAERAMQIIRGYCPDAVFQLGIGCDGIANRVKSGEWSVQRAVDRLVEVADLAHRLGCEAIEYDPEAAWKVMENSREWTALGEVSRGAIKAIRAKYPDLFQMHTSYDHIMYHPQDRRPGRDDPGMYDWSGWCGEGGVDGECYQVYAGDGDDSPETFTSTAGALQRFERHEEQLTTAVNKGWIRPDLGPGGAGCMIYVQSHSVSTAGSVALATRRTHVSWWATPSRTDARGLMAMQMSCALEKMGLKGPNAAREWQEKNYAKGCGYDDTIDGLAGPSMYRAMGLTPIRV